MDEYSDNLSLRNRASLNIFSLLHISRHSGMQFIEVYTKVCYDNFV